MKISHKYKFVYINIPFVGWDGNELEDFSDITGSNDFNSDYYTHTRPNKLKSHFEAHGWDWNQYFKFAVVRNPWARIVNRSIELGEENIKVDHSIEYKLPYINHQHWWTHEDDSQLLDLVCSWETLQSDIDFFCKQVGMQEIILHSNQDKLKTHFSNYYTEPGREIIQSGCAEDIKRFGYIFEKKSSDSKLKKFHISAKSKKNTSKFPDFIVPGFQKCATTSIKWNLNKHPKIQFSKTGELNFFNSNYKLGVNWYKSHFSDNGILYGDKSPNYFLKNTELAVKRMKECGLSECKFLISVRNPINRAYSAFNHYVNELPQSKEWFGWDSDLSFYENLLNESKILKTKINSVDSNFISAGFYMRHIDILRKEYSDDNIKIVVQEHLETNPSKVFSEIFDFLGVENFAIENKIHNKYEYKKNISDKAFELLTDIYSSHNNKLFDYLGYEIEEWQK